MVEAGLMSGTTAKTPGPPGPKPALTCALDEPKRAARSGHDRERVPEGVELGDRPGRRWLTRPVRRTRQRLACPRRAMLAIRTCGQLRSPQALNAVTSARDTVMVT